MGWSEVKHHTFFSFPQWFISSIFFFLQWCIYTRPDKMWTPNSSAQFNSSKASLGIKGMFEQPPEWQVKSIQDNFNVFLFYLLSEWCIFAYWRTDEASSLIVSLKTPRSIHTPSPHSFSLVETFCSHRSLKVRECFNICSIHISCSQKSFVESPSLM